MYIAAPLGRLGLRGAAARRSATWPLALVGSGPRHTRAILNTPLLSWTFTAYYDVSHARNNLPLGRSFGLHSGSYSLT